MTCVLYDSCDLENEVRTIGRSVVMAYVASRTFLKVLQHDNLSKLLYNVNDPKYGEYQTQVSGKRQFYQIFRTQLIGKYSKLVEIASKKLCKFQTCTCFKLQWRLGQDRLNLTKIENGSRIDYLDWHEKMVYPSYKRQYPFGINKNWEADFYKFYLSEHFNKLLELSIFDQFRVPNDGSEDTSCTFFC